MSSGERISAVTARLVLLVTVIAGTGVLLGVLLVPAAMAVSDVLGAIQRDVLDLPPLGDLDNPPQNSYIMAADGSQLAELNFEENRVPVTLDEIPQDAINAVLATEDADYYRHNGVDHLAIVRAALMNVSDGSIVSGASTITQQYVKLAYLTPEQTIGRKIQEAVYAIELEQQFTKDEILELYLNRSYFGSGVYGIGTAADRYFSKPLAELTLGEVATLAGIIRSPERNNPIASPDNARARRNIVLRQMASHGFITHAQAQAAIEQDLEISISEPPAPEHPFWTDWVARLLVNEDVAAALGSHTDALELLGATREERRKQVFQSGLRIHTTLDPEFQRHAEEVLAARLTYDDQTPEELAREVSGAIVSVDPETGAIVTMAVGPRGYGSCVEDGSWIGTGPRGELLCDRTKFNLAVPTRTNTTPGNPEGRHPGSALKPVLTAAALVDGVSPGLVLDARGPKDIKGCPGEGGRGSWRVNNSGGNAVLDMYGAVKQSSNVYHALLIAEVGPDKVRDMAGQLGITIDDIDPVCSIALGAAEITPLEMASAYATFANRGVHCAPFAITRIESADGELLWEHSPDCERVLDTAMADRLVDILAGPVAPGGTASHASLGRWPTRGKTGTTQNYMDAWFVGFVKQLSTAAWMGYDNGRLYFETEEAARAVCGTREDAVAPERDVWYCAEPSPRRLENVRIAGQHFARVFGGTIPAPMWTDFMRLAIQRFTPEGFPDPGPLPTARVPDLLRASSISEAERIAREAGFRLHVEETTHWRPSGTFVGQTPSVGDRAPLGTRITLQVSDGLGKLPSVPNVVGLTLEEAIKVLTRAGYGVSRRDVPVRREENVDLVLAQSPKAGTRLEPHQAHSIVVLDVGVLAKEDDDVSPPGRRPPGGGGGGGDGGGDPEPPPPDDED